MYTIVILTSKVFTSCSSQQIDPNYQMLTKKVFVDLTSHEAAEKRAEHGSQQKRAKIFCLVYTIEKFHDRIPAIKETWG